MKADCDYFHLKTYQPPSSTDLPKFTTKYDIYDQIRLRTIKINDVRYNNGVELKYLDKDFKVKYGVLQFPACKLKIESQKQYKNGIKTIIRSDLIIIRSKTKLQEPLDLSRGQSHGVYYRRISRISHAESLSQATSNESGCTSPSTRSSKAYNPIVAFTKLAVSKPGSPVVHDIDAGQVTPVSERQSTDFDKIDYARMKLAYRHPSMARPSIKAIPRLRSIEESPDLSHMHIDKPRVSSLKIGTIMGLEDSVMNEDDDVHVHFAGASVYDMDDEKFNRERMMFDLKTRFSRHLDEDSMTPTDMLLEEDDWKEYDDMIFGIQNYTAMEIWKQSCLNGTSISKFEQLYSNLIVYFKKWTGCEYRKPSQQQLRYFFMEFSKANSIQSGVELLMHSDQFEPFYLWFKALSLIIKDFKHIYDNKKRM